ncbi:3725_t:CDS:2 [Funneliformis caledonium]|uniref:3725_t:CDS:1 n=1 Tax=Funneliformis caledonium TaxID=1117310 RepID=A0A9N9HD52_9GLOM|nr:3725_t:CDS:2 [Funneliformis caledonium]
MSHSIIEDFIIPHILTMTTLPFNGTSVAHKASGNKTGRFPKDKRIVDEPGSNKGISGDLSTH